MMSAADRARLDQKHAEAVALMEDYAALVTGAVHDRNWTFAAVMAFEISLGSRALIVAEMGGE